LYQLLYSCSVKNTLLCLDFTVFTMGVTNSTKKPGMVSREGQYA
jgi:hypothetical protein